MKNIYKRVFGGVDRSAETELTSNDKCRFFTATAVTAEIQKESGRLPALPKMMCVLAVDKESGEESLLLLYKGAAVADYSNTLEGLDNLKTRVLAYRMNEAAKQYSTYEHI